MGMLEGKSCIITGGAGSIGLATARKFLAEGAKVLLVDLSEADLARAAEGLPADRVATCAADVGDVAQTRAYIDAAVSRWGRIDVLFCNAGISGSIAGIEDYPDDGLDLAFRVHVRGTFLGCKYALPHMGQGGSIIINSSVAGLGGSPGIYAYCTAKHAQIGFMRSLAKELAGRGIRVNSIHPGPVDNAFQTHIEDSFSPMMGGGDATALMNSMIPLGRHGKAEEIANSVLYLASDMSSFVTGSTHVVDGGFTA
ncbi:SDR family NAD(P)-dependent oxidoreductase [Pedomonas sp. V897]|uniref:SDR family NAD(P)-dependent oxidoreductase n=1 Tax=Pedomonas sp. V897 TaxID=3446482 RepID=UPI003EE2468D